MAHFDRVLTSKGLSSRVPMTASCTGVSATGPAVLVASGAMSIWLPRKGKWCGNKRRQCWILCCNSRPAEGACRYHSKYFTIDAPALDTVLERGLHMKPYQLPHPPIGVAATWPHRVLSGWLGRRGGFQSSSSILALHYLGEHWTVVVVVATAAGKTTDRRQWRIDRDVFVSQTSKEAQARACGPWPQLQGASAAEPPELQV